MEIVLINDAIIPKRVSKKSTGLDLYSSADVNIEVGSINKINTGICISLPENFHGSIRDKSSLEAKGLLTLGGVIDKDYTGEIIVIMTSLIEPIKIKKGQKIAQLIVSNILYPEMKKVKYFKKLKEMIKDLVKWIFKIISHITNYKIINTMSDTFISMIRNINLLYGFIYECTDLTNNLYEHNNYDHLVKQLCNEFVLPIINITKNKHIKEYNKHIKDPKNVGNICSYLMNICSERYFKLSQDEYSKIREFMDNNIYTIESILTPMHEFFYLSKKCYGNYCYCPCNCHCKKNNRKCVCLTDKYSEF